MITLISLIFNTSFLHGKTLSDGVIAYAKKDYKKSISILKKILVENQELEAKEKAVHLKYIGMSLLKLDKSPGALKTIEKAYQFDPNLKIDDIDKNDKEIIEAFQKARERVLRKSRKNQQKSRTKIQIESNISNVSIVLNNRYSFKPKQEYPTNPGINDVTIILLTGERRKFRLSVKKDHLNIYYIKLGKSADKDVAYHTLQVTGDLNQKFTENVQIEIKQSKNKGDRLEEENSEKQSRAGLRVRKRQKSPPKTSSSPKLIDFLPFGAGQFADEQYITGSLFAILQASLLYLTIDAYRVENEIADEATEKMKQLEELGSSREDLADYRESAQSVIDQQKQTRAAYAIMFAGAWISSTVYAVLTDKIQTRKTTENLNPESSLFNLTLNWDASQDRNKMANCYKKDCRQYPVQTLIRVNIGKPSLVSHPGYHQQLWASTNLPALNPTHLTNNDDTLNLTLGWNIRF